jgi:DNA-binding protein HU-beta
VFNLTKRELINRLAKKSGITKKLARKIVNDFPEMMKEALLDGETVDLRGFLSLEIVERPERIGCDPETREPITIKKGLRCRVRVSEMFRNKLREISETQEEL